MGENAAGAGGFDDGLEDSALISAAGALDGAARRGSAGPLRSWVIGWTHRFDPRARYPLEEYAGDATDSAGGAVRGFGDPVRAEPPPFDGPPGGQTGVGGEQAPPAVVRRLVEAVVDVLLERRPAEQVRRWVSREVFGLLSSVAQRRASIRFAARSTVRSIRLHAPALDAVESTVLVQDGPRVRAVALRFERSALPTAAHTRFEPGRFEPLRYESDRLEWRCTALQFA
jgi:hypothetical protein